MTHSQPKLVGLSSRVQGRQTSDVALRQRGSSHLYAIPPYSQKQRQCYLGKGGWHTYVAHELLAHSPDLRGQGGREHHHLLVVRCHLEDLLDVRAHVCMHQQSRSQVLSGTRRNPGAQWHTHSPRKNTRAPPRKDPPGPPTYLASPASYRTHPARSGALC